MKKLSIDIVGISPMLQHNGQTADPLNPFTKELKKISSKRAKTDDDHEQMAKIEFRAGLYWRDDIGVHMPMDNLSAMFLAAAKKHRLGPKTSSILISEDMPVEFKDSKNLSKLEANPDMHFRKSVNVQRQKVMRTRPMVPAGWTGTINLEIDVDGIDPDDIELLAVTAGKQVGMGDWRPGSPKPGPFGKFDILSIKEVQ